MLLFDGEVQGFGNRITANGGKTLLAQYQDRTATGKRRVVIGRFGVLTVLQARKAAQAVLGAAANGSDPFAERKALEEVARKSKVEAEFTFDKLIEAWSKAREGDRRPSYLREAAACLRRNLPHWKDRAASTITLAEAVRALDAVKQEKGTVAANRTLAYGRAAYGWAVKRQQMVTNL